MQSAEKDAIKIQHLNFCVIGCKRELVGADCVGVDENQNGILALGGFAKQGVNGRIGFAQACEPCAVKKTGMIGDKLIELREFENDVVGGIPVQAGAIVDAYFLGGEPLDATGETKTAGGAGERAKTVAQQRPRAAFFGEPVVVVGFRIVNVAADAFVLAIGIVEILRNVPAGRTWNSSE